MNSTKYLTSNSDKFKENSNNKDINNLYFMMTFTNTDKVIRYGEMKSKNIFNEKNKSSKKK